MRNERWADIASDEDALSPFKPMVAAGHLQAETDVQSQETPQPEEGEDIQSVREQLRILYEIRDGPFGATHESRLREQRDTVLSALDAIPASQKATFESRALLFYLRGKALDVAEEYVPDAEDMLGRAVKLDPTLGDAWNQLGTSFWKKGDYQSAHDCWQCSLIHSRDESSVKAAMRELSMAFRSKGGNAEESLRLAKEVVGRCILFASRAVARAQIAREGGMPRTQAPTRVRGCRAPQTVARRQNRAAAQHVHDGVARYAAGRSP